ncbi:hypothetical protein [Dankookia sp. P2]|uniref:hypothetical protein n=1 Tax=Dankookia sp. P2 TaxID=3423955 RepID=UPI003D66B41D
MLVYGDRQHSADPRARHAAIAARLARAATMPPGLERHAALAAALIEAGELAQGIADADFAARGMDELSPGAGLGHGPAADLCHGLAPVLA